MTTTVAIRAKFALLMAVVLAVATGALLAQSDDKPAIEPALAAGLLAQYDIAVIDVRSAEEIAETGVVGNAATIVHTDTDALAEFLGPPPGRAAILYCRSGRRAGVAIDTLEALGYDSLINAGGHADLSAAVAARAHPNPNPEDS
ncbi:MAG: rhodanese-like domain-containing protein [Wenzhouxiangellaceae bacterium]|nr:rhodanese-like domain-containing protein [Wenzhouxiangellaceae bacterium]